MSGAIALAKRGVKSCLSLGFDALGVNWLAHRTQLALRMPFIRILNYHDVPRAKAASFAEHLRIFRRRFVPVGRQELLDLIAGRWRHDRPGLAITFDDGLASHVRVAAPLLEEHGFLGWFFLPVRFLDTPRSEQAAYGKQHRISWSAAADDDGGAMSWHDARALDAAGHIVGCHTHSHVRLSSALRPEQLDLEIRQSRARIARELGHDVDVFCWVGGEEWSYSATAAEAIRAAGYRISFMNACGVTRPGSSLLQLHRLNVEAGYSPRFVRFLLSGLLDRVYAGRRQRVNRMTAANADVSAALAHSVG